MSSFHRFTFPADIDIYNTLDLVSDHGYSLEDMAYRADNIFVRVYSNNSQVVHIVTDESVDKSYIALNILSDEEKAMISSMNANTFSESIKLASSLDNPEDIYYATMGSGLGFDKSVYDCLASALKHSDPAVRLQALSSMVFLIGESWAKEIEPLLSKLSKDDTSEENREAAKEVLKALKKNNWNENMQHLNK